MQTTVFCPDCGGVLAGDRQPEQKPCTCEIGPETPKPGMPDPVKRAKVCCQCGKDLEGKKRFKDSLGYWCEACHYTEKKQETAGHVPCDSCGRYIAPAKLNEYENLKICTRCLRERKDALKKVRRPVAFGSEHREYERKRLMVLLAVAAVLLVIIILSSLRVL